MVNPSMGRGSGGKKTILDEDGASKGAPKIRTEYIYKDGMKPKPTEMEMGPRRFGVGEGTQPIRYKKPGRNKQVDPPKKFPDGNKPVTNSGTGASAVKSNVEVEEAHKKLLDGNKPVVKYSTGGMAAQAFVGETENKFPGGTTDGMANGPGVGATQFEFGGAIVPFKPVVPSRSQEEQSVDLIQFNDPEIDAVEMPPYEEDYSRPPSPLEPNAEDDNYNEYPDLDVELYLHLRNSSVEEYMKQENSRPIRLMEGSKVKLVPVSPIPPGMLDYSENDDVCCSESSSDSEGELTSPGVAVCTMKTVLEYERNRQRKINKDKPKTFSYHHFQKAWDAKWKIMVYQRLEDILENRNYLGIPDELVDYDKQFQAMFGPMDESHKQYTSFLNRFKRVRMEMLMKMLKEEMELIETLMTMKESRIKKIEIARRKKDIANQRKQLEQTLKNLPEASADTNPFTSRQFIDLFVVPRKLVPISSYVIRPKEVENFTEFELGQDMFIREGYNAAVLDVASKHVNVVFGDFRKDFYFFEPSPFKKQLAKGLKSKRVKPDTYIYQNWSMHLWKLNQSMLRHKMGIELGTFIKYYRKGVWITEEESLFGRFSDLEGVENLCEIFDIRKLEDGSQQKIILFHTLTKDLIVSPKEILRRVWMRIRHLLELGFVIEVNEIKTQYEQYYHQELFPLNWGFKNVEEFVKYSKQILPELDSIELKYSTHRCPLSKTTTIKVPVDEPVEKAVQETNVNLLDFRINLNEDGWSPINGTFSDEAYFAVEVPKQFGLEFVNVLDDNLRNVEFNES